MGFFVYVFDLFPCFFVSMFRSFGRSLFVCFFVWLCDCVVVCVVVFGFVVFCCVWFILFVCMLGWPFVPFFLDLCVYACLFGVVWLWLV